MDVSKSLNRLAILGLLACGGAWAQETVTVKVGLTAPGAAFLVDGQPYSSLQVFQWVVGSTHQVYFVQSQEPNGTVGNHQFTSVVPGTRYTFTGWSVTDQPPLDIGPLLIVKVQAGLTQILGEVTTEIKVEVSFNGFTSPGLACSPNAIPNEPREGVVVVASACFSSPASIWVVPGNISLTAAPFPGYIFSHWLINQNYVTDQNIPGYPIVIPSNVSAVFLKAKRARFRSNPLGLSLLVDQQTVKPDSQFAASNSGDPYCTVDFSLLPVGFPVGYVPLCIGDFDFLPGSQHVIGAAPVQKDALGKTWIFTGFSNGLGQNGIYTPNFDIATVDTISANFAPGVPTRVVTSPAGLSLNVDGTDDSNGSLLLWAEGQTHHVIAPATQTDAFGHPWKFVSWSNGGAADQNYKVPAGQLGLTLTATYEPLGKLHVDSVPSGLPFTVDGAACTTPCIILEKTAGAQVQIVAPALVTPDAFRRYEFRSWNGGSTANTFQVTIGNNAQLFVATYQVFHKLTASSTPANHVAFSFDPGSSDGFFAAGTPVAVTANPSDGFSFKRWSGDLSGTSLTASVVMNAPRFAVAVLDGFPFVTEVKNAAGTTPSPTVGPGSAISIYGDNLASSFNVTPAGELSQALDDVWVTLNDRLLPLFYISPQQINAQLFSDLADGQYTLTVHHTAQQDASKNFTVRRNSPGLFQWYPAQGSPTVAAFRENGTMLTAENPATLDETISIFGTGFGLYDRPLVDGFPTPDTGNWNVVDPVRVTVGTQSYTPVSSRAANGFAGMVVVRVRLTGTLPTGLADVKVTVNNVDSNTAKLPIR